MKKEVLENWIAQFESDYAEFEQSDKSVEVLRTLHEHHQSFKTELHQVIHESRGAMLVWDQVKDVVPQYNSLLKFYVEGLNSLRCWNALTTS